MKAAGILLLTKAGKALFLRRTAGAPDCPGCWDFPGGGVEGDETSEEAAIRETKEEIGRLPEGSRTVHTTTTGSAPKGVASPGAPGVGLPVPPDAPAAGPPPEVDYTTYLQRIAEEFAPTLNGEHDGYAWAPVESPPEPLHPGCRVALERLSMNELDVARAIADGRLTSPQRYENVWLFAIRFTGTGAAYRDKIDEFAVRSAEIHTSPDALARLNGLPVIWKHPKKALLDGDEFRSRIVGTIFLPYVAGDEVWAVAKIWVDAAARMMAEGGLSTSPGVNFADFSVNARLTLSSGEKVLVEGDPSLVDHVAVCQLGVWDKGGDPAGIRAESSREDSAMADDKDEKKEEAKQDAKRDDAAKKDEFPPKDKDKDDAKKDARKDGDEEKGEKKEDARKDADAGKQLDKNLTHTLLDAMNSLKDTVMGFGKRMDAMEEREKTDAKRHDAKRKDEDEEGGEKAKELAAQDKAKKDGAKKDEGKRDDARHDSALTDRLSAVETAVKEARSLIPKDQDDADYAAMADAQARADDVFADFGRRAPRPLQGESLGAYERRCVRMLQDHSPTWKGKDVATAFADSAAFGVVRDQVYAEARADAANPTNNKPGELRMVERKRDGHTVREFYGQPRDWMDPLAGPVQLRGTGTFLTGGLGRD